MYFNNFSKCKVREVEEVVWITKHPYSDEIIPRNDVVILKLKSEFKMIQNEVQKICLPSMMEEWAPDSKFKCFISGFGLSSIRQLSLDDWNDLHKNFGLPPVTICLLYTSPSPRD